METKIVLNTFWNANVKGLFLLVNQKDGTIIKDGFESISEVADWERQNITDEQNECEIFFGVSL